MGVSHAQAVWLKDKVYVGGGGKPSVYGFALTTYHSQLVLVGGNEYVGENIFGDATNKLWILSEDGQWQETLPPMPITCDYRSSAVSHGDHLLVISDDSPNNKVYVYNGDHWASAQQPPLRLYTIRSTMFNGHWYLMGGEYLTFPQQTYVYSCSVDSLLASCQPSETSQPSSIWKRLTGVPARRCYPTVFGNRMVAVGHGSPSTTTSLHAYSSLTQAWVHVGDAPLIDTTYIPTLCAVVLPSNELMIMRGQMAFKATLKCKLTLI